MKVSIIGAGTIGQATGIGLQEYGHQVIFYDTNPLEQLAARGYRVAGISEAIRESNIHMICVPTPLNDDSFDLSFVEAAVKEVAQEIKGKDEYQLVVLRSTVLPFTTRTLIPLLGECGVCYNPEFLREAHAAKDFTNPPIVVIGEIDKCSGDVLAELYGPFLAPLLRTSLENAEAIKCLSNVYNAMKVSFFNTVWLIAKECDLDHKVISEAMVKASLGVQVPEYYTRGGWAFNGNCLPKDLAASITFLKEHGLDDQLFQAVANVNKAMKTLSEVAGGVW